jgi:hypothetical protein
VERGWTPLPCALETDLRIVSQSLRVNGMLVPHMFLELPPTLYDADLNVEFCYPSNDDVFARFGCIGEVPFKPKGMLSMDLACENEFCGVDYSLLKASSWANDTLHEDQVRICTVFELLGGRTLEGECKRLWPKMWKVMLVIALMMNDPSTEWSHATRKPVQEERPAPVEQMGTGVNDSFFPLQLGRGRKRSQGSGEGSSSGAAGSKQGKGNSGKGKGKGKSAKGKGKGKHGAGGRPAPRDVEVEDDVREALELQWKMKILRDRDFVLDNFVSDLDGSIPGAGLKTTIESRVIRMPIVDMFGERTSLPDMLGDDSAIARKFMGMCILHADMRAKENMVGHMETRLRDRANSSSSNAAALEAFNDAMNTHLKIRHSIALNADTKIVYPVSFDGRDVKNLRQDWLGLAHLSLADLRNCARTGIWPSLYFNALQKALVASGQCEDVINDLPEYAECAAHYARAMHEARKMPADLRANPELAYVTFEEQSKLFTAKWIKLGFGFKAYGYHLWANLPVLFRKWGSLEGMCQSYVEAAIGKLSRLLPHLQLKPGGRYSKEVEAAGAPAKLAELERRRATMDSPAKTIVEELSLETFETKYGISTGDKFALPLREICLRIDEAIVAGKVVPHAKYKLYWQRYMVVNAVRAFAVGKAQCRRAVRAGSRAYRDLRNEVLEYYAPHRDRLPVSSGHTNAEYEKIVQKLRSDRWRSAARLPGWGGGAGGRKEVTGALAYQRIKRFPERWGGASSKLGLHEKKTL